MISGVVGKGKDPHVKTTCGAPEKPGEILRSRCSLRMTTVGVRGARRYAPSWWAKSIALTETTSKSPGWALSGFPALPLPNSSGR